MSSIELINPQAESVGRAPALQVNTNTNRAMALPMSSSYRCQACIPNFRIEHRILLAIHIESALDGRSVGNPLRYQPQPSSFSQ
ncbi:uncharacterized protein C8R40DRAFT_1168640 [Lentinula edodes]|uniref:uncharacterized protein n=1 Tax=Lentinula edodes TaxID=5353 RepID=UPI001E8D88EA|nr:uncharacterized protein C8R40DRAFT_1168640 [Lentinula edodes]KAH7877299.1 hypothetical protein C8R40DRAFT_1168640 [Lentinula edodes]KAJ3912109.1 hypothetical protein F5877DRAFT_85176 [Lentinula edodes]